jgi:hypothetical protein
VKMPGFQPEEMHMTTKTAWVIAAAVATLLTGCAHDGKRYFFPPGELRVEVNYVNNTITVSPEVFISPVSKKKYDIVWTLPDGLGLKFADNGIDIDGVLTSEVIEGARAGTDQIAKGVRLLKQQGQVTECKRKGDLAFTCKNANDFPAIYKYTVRLLKDGVALNPKDPMIVNW